MVLFADVAGPARADEKAEYLAAAREAKLTGAGISAVGFGLNALGASLLVAGVTMPNSCFSSFAPEEGPCGGGASPAQSAASHRAQSIFISGVLVSLSSDLIMLVGLPVWATGARRERALRRRTSSSNDALFRF